MTRSASKSPKRAPKVGFVSLGCPKALVDSERILTHLRAEGYEVSPMSRSMRSVRPSSRTAA
jgi:ribosomal protein S12 methylthiotransferase